MKKIKISTLTAIITFVFTIGLASTKIEALNRQVILLQQKVEIPINPDKNPTVVKVEKKKAYKEEMREIIPEPVEQKTTEELIIEKCGEYGIDNSIPVAISKIETGYYTSNAHNNYNNPGGIMTYDNDNNEYVLKYFNTIEEGVDYFVSNLVDNYFSVGLCSVEEIGHKYCPGDAGWIRQVNILKND